MELMYFMDCYRPCEQGSRTQKGKKLNFVNPGQWRQETVEARGTVIAPFLP